MDANLTQVVFDKGGIGQIGALGDVGQIITWISEKAGVPNDVTTIFIGVFTLLLVFAIFAKSLSKIIAKIASFSVLLYLIVVGYYYLNLSQPDFAKINNPLKIVKFESLQKEYGKNSKDIFFKIATNKDAYFYIFTQKYGSHKLLMIFPNKHRKDYHIKANTSREIGSFKIAKYDGDERVVLIASKKDIINYNQTFTLKSTTFTQTDEETLNKELAYNPNSSTHSSNHVQEMTKNEVDRAEITLKVLPESKDSIKAEIKNRNFIVDEEIDIDITASSNGYVKIYDVDLNSFSIKYIKQTEVKSGLNKSYIISKEPKGRHLLLFVYNKDKFSLEPSQIDVKEIVRKGGNIYKVSFDGKEYIYDTQNFEVK